MKKTDSIWTRYRVTFKFLTRLCASVPADPEIISKWIAARSPKVKPAGGKSIEEINEEVIATLAEPEEEQFAMLVFQRVNDRIVMRAATVKAHIKDCARQLSSLYIGKIEGEKSFAVRVLNGVYLNEREYWLSVLRNGKPVGDADGAYDKPIHVRGPRGQQINALKRLEYMNPGVTMSFELKVLGKSVTLSDLTKIFEYGGTHGYGGERGDGEGRYEFTIEVL